LEDNFKVKINVDQEKLEKLAIRRIKSKMDLSFVSAEAKNVRKKLSINTNQAFEMNEFDIESVPSRNKNRKKDSKASQTSHKHNGPLFFIDNFIYNTNENENDEDVLDSKDKGENDDCVNVKIEEVVRVFNNNSYDTVRPEDYERIRRGIEKKENQGSDEDNNYHTEP
jgi:hypothetical protein